LCGRKNKPHILCFYGKLWENYGNIVGKLWETHVNYDFWNH
jgi:hypothetical protein